MKEHLGDIRDVQVYEHWRVLEGKREKPIPLRIPKPSLLERFKAFTLALRVIQGDIPRHEQEGGDIVG